MDAHIIAASLHVRLECPNSTFGWHRFLWDPPAPNLRNSWAGGEEPALEIRADEKRRRLKYLFDTNHRVDCGQKSEWDITGEKTVVKRDLPIQPDVPAPQE